MLLTFEEQPFNIKVIFQSINIYKSNILLKYFFTSGWLERKPRNFHE